MPNITPNVEFNNVAREWRCKWSEDNDKASLVALQENLNKFLATVKEKAGEGVKV